MDTLTHLRPADYIISQWSGGKTTQLAIAPRKAVYGDRDFLWRISSATVALEQSDFTPLPDYERWIMPLTAPLTMSHDGGDSIRLEPFGSYRFDGAAQTSSFGCCTDFNLMVRKGAGDGHMLSVRLSPGSLYSPAPQAFAPAGFPATCAVFIYCAAGSANLCAGNQSIDFCRQEAILAEGAEPSMTIRAKEADTRLAIAFVYGKA